MEAELHALVSGFDDSYVMREIMKELLGYCQNTTDFIDNKTVFDVVAKDGTTQEKHLQIDVFGIRES